ncbi:MAG: hydrogenase expression/formation protein HypE [Clostridiales Family XIII bacterium]|jgi:hydrogenase expression/formation protein HypE|nr:hydrogenase expression/formation protein HypE [Clostridiales Family XIII bacterium]
MKITAAHGSGGRDSARLMEDIFGKRFSNPILRKMEDAAVLRVSGDIAVSTDSFVVTPLEFRGGNIGKLSICGTVNDLLVMGAKPAYITCGFILEEGLETELLDRVAASMAAEAAEAGVLIVAGDTKVVSGAGGLYINTTGIGEVPKGRVLSASSCGSGDVVILSGELGEHHACILSERMGIDNMIASDCACLGDVTEALFASGARVRAMRDVTRGGLGTVLNEIASASQCRIELAEESVPVSAAVKGFCGLMGLDPLYMGNEGKLVAFVAEDKAAEALAAVRSVCHGRNAAIIGAVSANIDGERTAGVYMKTRLGGTRRIDVLYGEGLPRIC